MFIDKKESFKLFDKIAPSYDRVNRIMTFGLDTSWRKKLYDFLPKNCKSVLDGATGTADQILFLLDKGLKADHIVGIDLSEGMLEIGRKKLKEKYPSNKVELCKGSLLELPFENETFEAVTVSFGVRNVPDLSLCLEELYRVLKKNGTCLILECSRPQNKIIAFFHKLYMQKMMPLVGGLFSKNKGAYEYLNITTSQFPCGSDFLKYLKQAGYKSCEAFPLSLGAVTLYVARK